MSVVAGCSVVPGWTKIPIRRFSRSSSFSRPTSRFVLLGLPTPVLRPVSSEFGIAVRHLHKQRGFTFRAMASSADPTNKPFSVLFVCLGNICRSPAAEGVFADIVKKNGLTANFKIDSAGTINYHEGNPADSRMRSASKKRGIEITSISRPIRPSDFREFDLILAMDKQNREDILEAFERWQARESFPADAASKVKLMCSYCKRHKETEVPDPYYGGPQGFEKVLDILEDACGSLLDSILSQNQQMFKEGEEIIVEVQPNVEVPALINSCEARYMIPITVCVSVSKERSVVFILAATSKSKGKGS